MRVWTLTGALIDLFAAISLALRGAIKGHEEPFSPVTDRDSSGVYLASGT